MDTRITRENLGNVAVRLGNLPWRWVKAERIFSNIAELHGFVPISKDAPENLTLAMETADGFETINFADSKLITNPPGSDTRESHIVEMCDEQGGLMNARDLHCLYLPIGFAQDILRWRELYGVVLPHGVWEDFRDETRSEDEGGSPEAFKSHFVGPMWFVVYPPKA